MFSNYLKNNNQIENKSHPEKVCRPDHKYSEP
jgi:hypothetical protein